MGKESLKINFKNLGKIDYLEFLKLQEKLVKEKENYLFFATHNPVYTVGKNEKEDFPFAIKVDRGGSITYFDEGTLMVYFIFNIKNPAFFYKKVKKVLLRFFNDLNKNIYYDKNNPGFYIENRKIASLGFKYENSRSKHGVSIHINPNLKNFNKINPCNLKGIKATSLKNEGIIISKDEAIDKLTKLIKEEFNEA